MEKGSCKDMKEVKESESTQNDKGTRKSVLENSNSILGICANLYKSLPISCKPKTKEWNVVAAIVQRNNFNQRPGQYLKCVAMASGTKCIGHDKLCSNGFIINDSHAEVLVRRSFLLYLYDQFNLAIDEEDKKRRLSIFYWNTTRELFGLKRGITFHFVTTRIPCGDACIPIFEYNPLFDDDIVLGTMDNSLSSENMVFTGAKIIEGRNDIINIEPHIGVKRTCTDDSYPNSPKKRIIKPDENKSTISDDCNKVEEVQISDGENCVNNMNNIILDATTDNIDTKLQPINNSPISVEEKHKDLLEQTVANERTKPGRGVSTVSMSCSDKLAKWQLMGLQGALLSTVLLKPIYFKSITICNSKPDLRTQEAVERAIWKRYLNSHFYHYKYQLYPPNVKLSRTTFDEEPIDSPDLHPNPISFIWTELYDKSVKKFELSVNGWKLGVNKKILYTPTASLRVSRYNLLKLYYDLLKKMPLTQQKFEIDSLEALETMTYSDLKSLAVEYQHAWLNSKVQYFKCWTEKPEACKNFTLKENLEIETK